MAADTAIAEDRIAMAVGRRPFRTYVDSFRAFKRLGQSRAFSPGIGGTVTKQYTDPNGQIGTTATRTGANGGTETTTGTGTIGNGSISDQRTTTYTGANGASGTRSVDVSGTPNSIDRSVTGTGTGSNGGTWQRDTSTSGTRGQGATTTGTITGTTASGKPVSKTIGDIAPPTPTSPPQ